MSDFKEQLETFNRENPPPKVRRFLTKEPRGKTTETLEHGAFIFNAYDHLEKLDSPSTQAFIDAQNERTSGFLQKNAVFQKEMADIENTRHIPEKSEWVERKAQKFGQHTFHNRQNSGTGAYEYLVQREGESEPRVYLSSKQFSDGHSSRMEMIKVSKDGNSVIYQLSHAGEIADEVRHIAFHEDGTFTDTHEANVRIGKVGEVRIDSDMKGFKYHDWSNENSNWVMKHHVIGDGPENDKLLLDMKIRNSSPREHPVETEAGGESQMEYLRADWNLGRANALYMRPRGSEEEYKEIRNDGASYYRPIMETAGKLLVLTNEGAPRGKIIALDIANPQKEETVVAEHSQDVLEDALLQENGKLLLPYKHDTASRLAWHELSGKHIKDVPLPPHSKIIEYPTARAKDADFAIKVTSCEVQSETYDYHFKDNSLTLTIAAKDRLEDTVVERIRATSKDGTEVPMTVIRHKDTKLDGTAAVQLRGYGGFNHSIDAGWNSTAADWVRKGGIYVEANLRGGGEFGQEWYDGGRLHNKQNTFDDFAACAEKLVEKNYTKPERLAIIGTSNGGLLTLATALQRPELFGAVISQVPVADMLYGGWEAEYGRNRAVREDFEKAMSYSPTHNIRDKQKYPPMLVSTSTKDSVVPAWHSLKFAATMQDKSPETLCLLKVSREWEHNPTTEDGIRQRRAEAHAFIEQAIGPIDQKKYKAYLKEQGQEASPKWTERVKETNVTTLSR